MQTFINFGVFLVALLHLWFLVLEIFFWQKPLGLKVFRLELGFAKQSAALAANQGLYNGFLSAGLIWSLFASEPIFAWQLKSFFLGCVVMAGIFGALTVSRKILMIQAAPAAFVLALLIFNAYI